MRISKKKLKIFVPLNFFLPNFIPPLHFDWKIFVPQPPTSPPSKKRGHQIWFLRNFELFRRTEDLYRMYRGVKEKWAYVFPLVPLMLYSCICTVPGWSSALQISSQRSTSLPVHEQACTRGYSFVLPLPPKYRGSSAFNLLSTGLSVNGKNILGLYFLKGREGVVFE